jgi:hypothetical protein
MPFDSTPQLPDISTPTVANLVWVLRHREVWPQGFQWNYGDCDHCAMGLAARLWSEIVSANTYTLAVALNITHFQSQEAFLNACLDKHMRDISPDDVADMLEQISGAPF